MSYDIASGRSCELVHIIENFSQNDAVSSGAPVEAAGSW